MGSMPTCPKCGNKYPLSFERCPVDGEALKLEDDADPMLGQVLLGTYRVIEPLGQGGMAKVYLAENERVGRKFALKVLSAALALDADIVERFFREARTSASLRHPNIVEVVDCGRTEQNVPFMVLELLDGEDVDSLMGREGKLGVDRSLAIAAMAADALEAAHSEGIVHRDIKPSNMFIETTRTGAEQVKLLDFGIARLMGDSRLTKCGEVLGTPLYMSPEQARGDADLDHRSDVYSLGATLFHMLCGQPVFDGDTGLSIMIQHISEDPPSARKLCPDLSKRHSKLIRRMLAKDPADRPQTAGEIHRELTSVEPVRETAMSLTETGLHAPVAMEEVRIVTVLVADIEMSASADVEALTRETRRVYETLAEEVQHQGGQVEHLAGNRAVGLFGLALSFGDEPVRAVRAAVAARTRLGGRTGVRIAVGTGRALAQASGVSTGPAAGAAARLLEMVSSGGIAVDASTYSRVRGIYHTRALNTAEGQEPAYEIGGRRDRAGLQSAPGLFGRDAVAVGRDGEMAQLQDVFRKLVDNPQPVIVSITGDPGMGKTQLKQDFVLQLDSLHEGDVTYLEGAAEPLSREQPFAALGQAMRRRARLETDCSEGEALERLQKLVTQVGVERDDRMVSELLSIAAGVSIPHSPSIQALRETPQRLRDRTIDAFILLVDAMSRSGPVILCIEDAQHVDGSTLDALTRLCSEARGRPVLVLLVGRPEMQQVVGDAFLDAGAHFKLKLEPLSRSETRAMVRNLLDSEPPGSLLEEIWRRTEGVPLFVEEFLLALRHQSTLAMDPENGKWTFSGAQDLSRIPSTVEGMLQARLDALDAAQKQAVRRAAVLGSVFWDDALAALGVDGCASVLSALARHDVIVARHESTVGACREYEFRSAMLRDVAYKMTPGRERASLHEKAARWLAGHGATPAVLASHLDLAGKEAEAAVQYVRAGDAARESYANTDALYHYDRAVQLLAGESKESTSGVLDSHFSALFGKEQVLARLGRRDEALMVLEEVSSLAQAAGDAKNAARAAVRRGALVRLTNPRKARLILEKALDACRRAGDVEWECRALGQLAQSAAYGGDLDRGAEIAAEAVAAARGLESRQLLLRALMDDGTINVIRNGHWHGLPSFLEAIEIAREVGDVESEADLLMRRGFLWSELGDIESAEQDLEAARQLLRKTGNRRVLAFTLHNLGWVLWKAGKAVEARLVEEEALEVSRQSHLGQVVMATDIYLALFDIGEDDAERALERSRAVRQEASSKGHTEPEMFACMAEALSLLALKRWDDAVDAGLKAVENYEKLGGTQQFEVELHLVTASCLSDAGRSKEADEMLEKARQACARRIEPITDEAARKRLVEGIGVGLPLSLLPDCSDLLPLA